MIIVFTGHRDVIPLNSELLRILDKYPGALWLHGGAPGADSYVDDFLVEHKVAKQIVRPDYKKYRDRPKYAPLKRDEDMVDIGDVVVAAYDGRKTGGTFHTVEYAERLHKTVERVTFDRTSQVVRK